MAGFGRRVNGARSGGGRSPTPPDTSQAPDGGPFGSVVPVGGGGGGAMAGASSGSRSTGPEDMQRPPVSDKTLCQTGAGPEQKRWRAVPAGYRCFRGAEAGPAGAADAKPGQLGRCILQVVAVSVSAPSILASVFQPRPVCSVSYFTPLVKVEMYNG